MQPILLNRRSFLAASTTGLAFASLATGAENSAPSKWAAISYSTTSRSWHTSWGFGDRDNAEKAAITNNSAADAKLATSGAGVWLALSTADGGWGSGSGYTLNAASQSARDACKKFTGSEGEVVASVFGGEHGVDFSIQFDPAFTADDRRLLGKGVQSMRSLLNCVAGQPVNGIAQDYWIDDKILRRYFTHHEPSPQRQRDLMGTQVFYMSQYSHPDLHLIAYDEHSEYWGRATVGLVIIPYGTSSADEMVGNVDRGSKDTKPQFSIEVNRHWLGREGAGSESLVWAGVLAHELMHNLGHMHGLDDYRDRLQINAVQQLVRSRGAYKAGDPCPTFACDCRRQWLS